MSSIKEVIMLTYIFYSFIVLGGKGCDVQWSRYYQVTNKNYSMKGETTSDESVFRWQEYGPQDKQTITTNCKVLNVDGIKR